MEKILFFDTETTGIVPMVKTAAGKQKLNPVECFNEYPHICQFSWKIGETERDFLIIPSGWTIPPETTKVHGITTEKARAAGVPFVDAARQFFSDLENADKICAHNIGFDVFMIAANCVREFGRAWFESRQYLIRKDRQLDTMTGPVINFVAATYPDGKPGKFPKLTELYAKLFNAEFPAHNSLEDVRALEKCYFELKNRKII